MSHAGAVMSAASPAETRVAVDQLRREVTVLRDQLATATSDSEAQVGYLKHELQGKESALEHLRRRVDESSAVGVAEKARLTKRYEDKIHELEEGLDRAEERADAAESELQSLKEFKADKARTEAELGRAREESVAVRRASEEQLAVLERRHFEERLRNQREMQERLQEMRKQACEEAVGRLNELTKHVFAENQQYEQRLRGHFDTLKDMDQRRVALEARSESLAQENTLLRDQVKELARLSGERKRRVAELQAESQGLRASLDEERGKGQEERARLAEENAALKEQVADATAAAVLKKRVQALQKEVARANARHKKLLGERGFAERLLVETLAEVRANSLRAASAPSRQGSSQAPTSPARFPRIGPPDSGGATAEQAPEGTSALASSLGGGSSSGSLHTLEEVCEVDYQKLTWDQKENVIIVLLSKLRSKKSLAPKSQPPPPAPKPPPQFPSLVPDFLQKQAMAGPEDLLPDVSEASKPPLQ